MSSYVSFRVRQAMYAVRGQVPTRAMKIQHEIENARASGQKNPHPFEKLIFCNIGNPQALGSPPLSFVRQVLSLLDYPTLLKSGETVRSLYPLDVLNRAEDMLSKMNFISGAYTDSMGFEFIRKDVATFLTTRDRVYNQAIEEADPSDIFLTDGASSGVKAVLQLVVGQSSDSVMIPVPQYPLYTATISLLGGHVTPYYLDESAGWSMNREVLSNAYRKSKEQGANPRLLVVINPGNPTGQVLTEAAIRDVIEFASENELMILADEVYQENIYCSDKKFRSFREILLSSSYKNLVPLFSVHSTSKGIIGECGRRGGYLEAINVHPEMKKELVKLMSINLCANVGGQLLVDLMVRPPQASHESYESYQKEYATVANALRKKASRLYTQLNKIPGIRCNPIEGAMYAFPSLHLSDKYLEYHIKKNKSECTSIEPDTRWALELLEATGVVVVPGSGFGQLDGTFHFRTTILPQEEDLEYMTEKIKNFQFEHHQRYT